MQLRISREVTAQKGMMGGDKGNSYHLFAQLEVDADEQAHIDRHKLRIEALTTRRAGDFDVDIHTVGNLIDGHSAYADTLSALIQLEGNLVASVRDFAGTIDFARAFDDDRVVELTRSSADADLVGAP